MKRFLLPLLVLCAVLAPACQNPAPNNNNNGANQNTGNINQGITGNTNTGMAARDPKNKAVMITISDDGAGHPKVAVAPEDIYLSKMNGQKLRFYVFNNLDADVKEVKVEFKSSAGDPMDGGYTFTAVPSGTDTKSNSRGVKAGQANGPYKYTVTVTIDGVGTPVSLDPEVEVGN